MHFQSIQTKPMSYFASTFLSLSLSFSPSLYFSLSSSSPCSVGSVRGSWVTPPRGQTWGFGTASSTATSATSAPAVSHTKSHPRMHTRIHICILSLALSLLYICLPRFHMINSYITHWLVHCPFHSFNLTEIRVLCTQLPQEIHVFSLIPLNMIINYYRIYGCPYCIVTLFSAAGQPTTLWRHWESTRITEKLSPFCLFLQ